MRVYLNMFKDFTKFLFLLAGAMLWIQMPQQCLCSPIEKLQDSDFGSVINLSDLNSKAYTERDGASYQEVLTNAFGAENMQQVGTQAGEFAATEMTHLAESEAQHGFHKVQDMTEKRVDKYVNVVEDGIIG